MFSLNKGRCPRCVMHLDLCLCSLIPSLATRTQVVLMLHATEVKKPSNTGRLARLCLPSSEIRVRGSRDGNPVSLEGLVDNQHETLLLTLSDRSEELTPDYVSALTKPVRLLVPDGSWSQASRHAAMLAKQLPGVRHVKLVASKPSVYRLRAEHLADGMATFEAVARALGLLEGEAGPSIQEEMEKLFLVMTDRVMWTRGKLAEAAVTGGIPGRR